MGEIPFCWTSSCTQAHRERTNPAVDALGRGTRQPERTWGSWKLHDSPILVSEQLLLLVRSTSTWVHEASRFAVEDGNVQENLAVGGRGLRLVGQLLHHGQ